MWTPDWLAQMGPKRGEGKRAARMDAIPVRWGGLQDASKTALPGSPGQAIVGAAA
ncbi:hypothetical protein [Neoroseomonas oryzicola]|uniref:hypothetical protein n=1 Tax=Neoroseomonas oryzicola TaxID=535904 RepID=UPI001FD814CE|nr:hypothetical protein [Neoroseomonas oryzicola]